MVFKKDTQPEYERWRIFKGIDKVSSCLGEFISRDRTEVYYFTGSRLGAVTPLDILKVHAPETTKLQTVGRQIGKLPLNDDAHVIARLMLERGLKSVPLKVEGNEVYVMTAAGIVSSRARSLDRYTVRDVMTPAPAMVEASDRASKVRKEMIRKGIEHILVRNEKSYSIVTARRMIMEVYAEGSPTTGQFSGKSVAKFEFPVSRIAYEIEKVQPETRLVEILEHLIREPYAVVVELWGELQGIVTLSDILKVFVKRSRSYPSYYIIGLPEGPFEYESAKMKVERFSRFASKILGELNEIRCVVKESKEKRYEIELYVNSGEGSFSFSERGYDIAEAFDRLIAKAKNRLSRIAGIRQRRNSIRKVIER